MSGEQLAGYRAAREAQWCRFERATQGCDRSEPNRPEFREYFGLGEYAGGGVEAPLTFKAYLVGTREVRDDSDYPAAFSGSDVDTQTEVRTVTTESVVPLVTSEGAFWLSGKDLAALCVAGCPSASAEVRRRQVKRAGKRAAALSGELARWERVTA